jgi:hypothetical protein
MRDPGTVSPPAYATAALLDEDPCGLWPECGCDDECARLRPVAARPKVRIVEFTLIVSIFALSAAVLWAIAHFSGGIHA